MTRVPDILESLNLLSTHRPADGKAAVRDYGFISCASRVQLKRVPFYEPCLILVLAGRKVIFDSDHPVACETGNMLAVPGPASFDLRNEPDARGRHYRALIVPFRAAHIERMRRAHAFDAAIPDGPARVLPFNGDDASLSSIRHYLDGSSIGRLREHRLMEILLVLADRDPRVLAYARAGESWSERVRAVLAEDLARDWELGEVCRRLATSESTLRRNLARERSGFRVLLQELRLTTALTSLLQTSMPVSRIAFDCGYQSVSRFSSNFHRRFGLPPTALREHVSETGHKLGVSEQLAAD